jgi:hypothetical protein
MWLGWEERRSPESVCVMNREINMEPGRRSIEGQLALMYIIGEEFGTAMRIPVSLDHRISVAV